MDANTLHCYRANYNLEQWESAWYHGFPMDAACLAIAELCNEVERLEGAGLTITNMRQQIAHLNDEIAGLRSDKSMLQAKLDEAAKDADRWRTIELLMFLGNVELNQGEDGGYAILLFPAENIVDQGWEGNSPEEVVDAVKCYGQAEKQAKTEVPAIVFYPDGSLGEEVEEVAKAFGVDANTLEPMVK